MADTVNDMLEELRGKLAEDSEEDLTDAVLVKALNAAQADGFDTLSKKYKSALAAKIEVAVPANGIIDIPDGIFQEKVTGVDLVYTSSTSYPLERVEPIDFWKLDTSNGSAYPVGYIILDRKIQLLPTPSSTTATVRIWYQRELKKLVKSQGRITRVVSATPEHVVLDDYLNGLSTDSDLLTSFFNVIGYDSGKVKGTFQIQNINGDRITIRSVPTDTLVLNETVSGEFADADPTIRRDDYICEVGGTCVPYFTDVLQNYLIHYAFVEVKGEHLGQEIINDIPKLKSLEKKVRSAWAGRQAATKIQNVSKNWVTRISKGRW